MKRIAIHELLKLLLPLLLIIGGRQCYADTVSIPLRYYHSDHLGSASWITNGNGTPVQYLQYMPHGEPFVNERTTGHEERFTFTGKERDSETGYSYFGARFYDSDLMTGWLSIDPQSDKFPNISPYNYCNWNPVKLKDQDGEAPIKAFVTAAKLVKKAYNIYKKTGNLTMKSLKKAGLDQFIDIVDDINTIFSGDASLTDRIAAGVDLLVGTEFNNKVVDAGKTGVKKTYQTYTKTNPTTGEVYSGRTSGTGEAWENVANRDKNHAKNKEGFGPAKLDMSSDNPDAIRYREQYLIELHGGAKSTGGTSGNAINGISPKNPKYDQYKTAYENEINK